MTKNQREKHIAELNAVLVNAGATLDRWGMYHINKYKFDTRAVNIKIYHENIKFKSVPMTKTDVAKFEKYVDYLKNKKEE